MQVVPFLCFISIFCLQLFEQVTLQAYVLLLDEGLVTDNVVCECVPTTDDCTSAQARFLRSL